MSKPHSFFSGPDAVPTGTRVRHDRRSADLAFQGPLTPVRVRGADGNLGRPLTIGVVSNPKSHLNGGSSHFPPALRSQTLFASPQTRNDLQDQLDDFAARGVDMLVIDGGDGTVRDVLTAARKAFRRMPCVAVLPSGKTNALALDLGIPVHWSVRSMLDALRAGRIATRAPVEVWRRGADRPEHVGFLLGAGAFVRATSLAQKTHRVGAFNGMAVGLSLMWSIAQTLFGSAENVWRQGDRMRIRGDVTVDRSFYLVLASTLERLPLGLKPFGRRRAGLKVLAVDAPPKKLAWHLPFLLAGSESRRLADNGYHHGSPQSFELDLDGEFILDGERYPGGELLIRMGEPLHFVVP
ncbi:diacylglycerol/lipid kinase family protein [Stakelama saccharophila]|uniref:Diacylglycerol kinase family protein n=1 Tax=Stakelama saccharophila TaxID=3075605 RepID=A0ABZ0B9H6_9SPHN|nr:diacylglycerol kinase family protein [Stakelama sp. W311]WNO54067.1 diacylglycerol kinase family protein [Stakelama sp. W311]